MKFLVSTTMSVISGPAQKRNLALVTLACWFSMGAFVASTLMHYVAIGNISPAVTAVAGGAIAAVISGCLKAA